MAQEILQVSPLPPFMMKALQEADYIVHDHTHIKDPGLPSKKASSSPTRQAC
jgi:hypothetical protein